ncbi:hypothetical protein GO986_19330 [Deinococcus sp. HMF7620]|uniref:Fibronectin type-III domain-containing protein n=1 Tax=Deinococcus arboris TaxID=2682977 RepID=A0A7C9LND6_9DEIO|nr:fibronectin type III domain-containing protein [Deinococcus arboris]MVN88898.1 hypothetical protein [Deinococcus arboris]
MTTLLLTGGTAYAWKPITHNYLAEEALRDALDDGFVTIPVLANGAPQNPPVTQTYRVDPDLLLALRANTAQYRAGVLGPDAYPDIATGQQVIHPPHSANKDDGSVRKGSDDWLQHLYTKGQQSQSGAVKAFVTGYLTHAAGDVFAHTFVNAYAGGPFDVDPHTNAAKHLVIEGYMGKRTPNLVEYDYSGMVTSGRFDGGLNNRTFYPSGDFSINGVENFIYDEMIDISRNTSLKTLYEGRTNVASIPYIYSNLRNVLGKHIDWYYDEKRSLETKIKNCKFYDIWCMNKYNFLYLNHVTVVWATKEYAIEWQRDIDDGLKEWAKTSHELALQMIYPSSDGNPANAGIDADRRAKVSDIIDDYLFNHLASMSGAPDQAGRVAYWVLKFIDEQFNMPESIKKAKANLIDFMLKNATGKTRTEWESYITSPEQKFDPVMTMAYGIDKDTRLPQQGTLINLQQMNQTVLNLPLDSSGQPDPAYNRPELRFSIDKFSPAYNTLIMSKLVLLSPSEFSRFVQGLPFEGTRPTSVRPNAMLGFVYSLDGRKDKQNPRVLSEVYGDCGAYNAVFKPQIGDDRCTNRNTTPAQPVPGNPSGLTATPEDSREVSLAWVAGSGATQHTVERRALPSGTYAVIATLGANAQGLTDLNVQPSRRYAYRVKAGNAAGYSTGTEVSVTTPADQAPCRPTGTATGQPSSKTDEAAPDFVKPC